MRRRSQEEMDDLVPIINREILNGFPDSFAFAGRDPIFSGARGGRQVSIDLSADEFVPLLDAGRAGFGATMQAMPSARPAATAPAIQDACNGMHPGDGIPDQRMRMANIPPLVRRFQAAENALQLVADLLLLAVIRQSSLGAAD